MNIYFSVSIAVLFMFGCQKTTKMDPQLTEQKQVEVEKKTEKPTPKPKPKVRYNIVYPKGWTIEKGYKGTVSMAISKLRQSNNAHATMNITISETIVKTSKEVFDLAMEQYELSINNITDVVERPVKLQSGVKGHEVVFEGSIQDRKMRFRIIHFLKGGLAFIVTAVSIVEAFEQDNKDFFEPAFQSFSLRESLMGNDIKRKYYSILYPEGWETSTDINWADTSALSPEETDDTFVENMAVTYELVPAMDLKNYVERSLKGIKASTKNFKLISKRATTLENGRIVYELIFDQTGGTLIVRTKMIYTLESGMGYIMVLAGEPDSFERYETLFDKTVESFRPHRN